MLKFVTAALLSLSLAANAAEIELAVIQFPEGKTVAELEQALARTRLADLANSNRTMSPEPYLKGGYILFTQRLPLADRLVTSTRLANEKADVDGHFSGQTLRVAITLSEGVKAGLRRFSSRTYTGCAALPPGQPRILGLRKISEKTQSTTRGQTTLSQNDYCTVIVGQVTK